MSVSMPSNLKESLAEVLWLDNGPHGEQPVIVGWIGPVTSHQICTIETEFVENPESWEDTFEHGPGTYLFRVHWCEDQIEYLCDVPRVTDPGYWELVFVKHEPFPVESTEHGPCLVK